MYFVSGVNYPVKLSGGVALIGDKALGIKEVNITDFTRNTDLFSYILNKSSEAELSSQEAGALYFSLKSA